MLRDNITGAMESPLREMLEGSLEDNAAPTGSVLYEWSGTGQVKDAIIALHGHLADYVVVHLRYGVVPDHDISWVPHDIYHEPLPMFPKF